MELPGPIPNYTQEHLLISPYPQTYMKQQMNLISLHNEFIEFQQHQNRLKNLTQRSEWTVVPSRPDLSQIKDDMNYLSEFISQPQIQPPISNRPDNARTYYTSNVFTMLPEPTKTIQKPMTNTSSQTDPLIQPPMYNSNLESLINSLKKSFDKPTAIDLVSYYTEKKQEEEKKPSKRKPPAEKNKASKKKKSIPTGSLCAICYEKQISVMVLPCRHVSMCSQCSIKLESNAKCPICRKDVEESIEIYLCGVEKE